MSRTPAAESPLVAALLICSIPLGAQWLNYPTAGVPKLANGQPDLKAPAPKTADGKPDLSGIWEPEKNLPCPPGGCQDMQVNHEFLDIGWSLKGGLPYQPWAADLVKARVASNSTSPGSRCLPIGIINLHNTPFFRRVVQIPGMVIILNEHDSAFRQIFTDGRPLPADPQPSWSGYSTGRWSGDTLVVDSNGFRDGIWLDRRGNPLTEAGKITERFRRVNYGRLEIDVTVDDPNAYTKPWTVKLAQTIVLDTNLLETYCTENEKDSPHYVGK
jgi:hypothetical protein